jgi:hypothetical protein
MTVFLITLGKVMTAAVVLALICHSVTLGLQLMSMTGTILNILGFGISVLVGIVLYKIFSHIFTEFKRKFRTSKEEE